MIFLIHAQRNAAFGFNQYRRRSKLLEILIHPLMTKYQTYDPHASLQSTEGVAESIIRPNPQIFKQASKADNLQASNAGND